MHPLLGLLASQPQLLAEHARGYAALLNEEFEDAFASWRRKALLQVLAACCLLVAVLFAGVAWMLWAVTPVLPSQASWVLVAVPLLPLFGSAVCLLMARKPSARRAFSTLTAQINADMVMLRTAGSP